MSTIRLAVDEDFNQRVLRAVRRKWPTVDILSVQDVGMRGAKDPEVLDWSAREGRVLLSGDRASLRKFAQDRANAGLPMPGVFLMRPYAPFPQLVEDIIVIAECGQEGEFEGRINYVPI